MLFLFYKIHFTILPAHKKCYFRGTENYDIEQTSPLTCVFPNSLEDWIVQTIITFNVSCSTFNIFY